MSEKSEKSKEEVKLQAGDGSAIVYQLYYAPEHAKLNQLASIATLEKRIDQLENLVGNNPDKLVSSNLDTFLIHD